MSNRGCSTCSNLGTSKHEYPCNECTNNRATDHYKPMTNADAIRNMSDEELAKFLQEAEDCGYRDASITPIIEGYGYMDMLEWLQAEVKEGNSNENT